MKNFEIGRHWLWAGAAAVALLLPGCGSSSGSDGQVRLINATTSHVGLDFYVGTDKAISNVAVGTASSYAGVASGNPATSVDDAGSTTALGSFSPTISNNQHSALIAYESNGGVYFAIITEEIAAPATGSAQLQVRNFSFDAGALDFYLTAHGTDAATDIANIASPNYAVPAPTAIGTPAVPVGGLVSPGTYDIVVTARGNKADIRLYIPSVTLADQQIASVLLTPTTGGVLVNGATLVQQGAFTAGANTSARVKLVNGNTGFPVVLTAGATTVDTAISAASVGTYVTVPSAATSSLNVSANGASVQVSPATLTAGVDYTVLVSGAAGTPTATLLTDNNHLPLSATNAKIRLVNGFAQAGRLSLVVDSLPAATNVSLGTGSTYTELLADTSGASIAVTPEVQVAGALNSTLCDLSLYGGGGVNGGVSITQRINANTVYSLYVLGANTGATPTTVTCLLRVDR